MKNVKLLGFLLLIVSFSSCSLEEALDLEDLEEEVELGSEIYYRWTEDLSFPANSGATRLRHFRFKL